MLRRNQEAGFSLMELMVGIAILVTIIAIAVPSFKRGQYKAKQQEAKTNLSSLFISMRQYFGEYGQYTSRLDAIGFKLDGKAYYKLGFAGDHAPPAPAIRPDAPQGTNTCYHTGTGQCPGPYITWQNMSTTSVAITGGASTCTPDDVSYCAFALAEHVAGSPDSWSINNNQEIKSGPQSWMD